jgi:phage terminase large subunit-like protein
LTPETSLGFEAIDFAKESLGLELFPWQEFFLIHSLELLEDGSLRFKKVLLLLPRQNGKSFIVSVRLLWRLFMEPGTQTLGSAHKLEAAEEIWALALGMVRRSELSADIAQTSNVNGNKFFRTVDDSRWKVQATNDDGGRSLTIDDLFFDELRQHRDYTAWAAMTGTMVARPNSQLLCASNAGEAKSEVLKIERDGALKAISECDVNSEVGLFEWSARDDRRIDDVDGWYEANPSLGWTITERSIRSQMSAPENKFRTEHLCQWVTVAAESPFGDGVWESRHDPESGIAAGSQIVLSVDVSANREMSYFAVSGWREDGKAHIEVIAQRAGTEWVVPTLVHKFAGIGAQSIVIQGKGAPASALIEHLRSAGLPVMECGGADLGAATGVFYDGIRNGQVFHLSQPVLDAAAATAVTKQLGDVFVFNRSKSPMDVAPLIAAEQAYWGLTVMSSRAEKPKTSSYESRGLVVV